MNPIFPLIAILLPIVGGALMPPLKIREGTPLRIYVACVTVATSLLCWAMLLFCPEERVELIAFTDALQLAVKLDALSRFFLGIIATLWPLTVLYGFSYMQGEERQRTFFTFFTIAFGVTIGVASSANLFTLYCFYELLTLSTAPLVMHTRTRDAIRAARTYFVFCLGGAAFGFVALVYYTISGGAVERSAMTQFFYLLGFFGFGAKAAVFPLHIWLPRASVAPTPVTALLHAVAVVKSGVFAIIRLTYFAYGTEALKGSFAQYVAMGFAVFTIVYGAAQAVREGHLKRRLAWSTVANLSYILFGVLLMTERGLSAGLQHMAYHAGFKILAFFCAGAVLKWTGREHVRELDGLGLRMPVTFTLFTIAALNLVGIPPFTGFLSKWSLLTAAAAAGTVEGYVGAGTILTAALLTAVYCLTAVRRAFFPDREADLSGLGMVHEADAMMLIPMCIIAAGLLVMPFFAGRISAVTDAVAASVALWQ